MEEEEEEVWLKWGDRVCCFDVTEDRRLDCISIARTWRLDPSTFVIEERHVRLDECGRSVRAIKSFKSAERDGMSKDRALRLEAQPFGLEMKVENKVKLKEEFDYKSLCRRREMELERLIAENERQGKSMLVAEEKLQQRLEEAETCVSQAERSRANTLEKMAIERAKHKKEHTEAMQKLEMGRAERQRMEKELKTTIQNMQQQKEMSEQAKQPDDEMLESRLQLENESQLRLQAETERDVCALRSGRVRDQERTSQDQELLMLSGRLEEETKDRRKLQEKVKNLQKQLSQFKFDADEAKGGLEKQVSRRNSFWSDSPRNTQIPNFSDISDHQNVTISKPFENEANQEKLVEAGGLTSMLRLLEQSNGETVCRVAAGAIGNLSMNDLTPEQPTLEEWLNLNPLKRGAKIEEIKGWIKASPVSVSTKIFLSGHLIEVSEQFVLLPFVPPKGLFRRFDFYQTLMDCKDAKLLVLYGRRRQGKTCALPTELLHARFSIAGIKDEVIFYHSGADEIPEGQLHTILRVLSHMHIPACWDEFTNLKINLSLAFKGTMEDNRLSWDPLSNLLFGSNERDVTDKGLNVAMMTSRGGRAAKLQGPTLEIIVGIYNSLVLAEEKEKLTENWGRRETAMKFLRRFSLYGYNLYEHIEKNSSEQSLERETISSMTFLSERRVKRETISSMTFLSERRVKALENLIAHKGKGHGIDRTDLHSLEEDGFIKKKITGRGGGQDWEFTDPQLIAYQWRGLQNNDKVDGFVFEMMVRTERNLLPGICKIIATATLSNEETVLQAASKMLHGDFGKGCEIDGMFTVTEKENNFLVMFSCKRSWDKADWKGFSNHLTALWSSNHSARKLLEDATCVVCVGLSALPVAESCQGVQDNTMNLPATDLHPFKAIALSRMFICMWDVIQSFEPLDFIFCPNQKH